VILSLLFGRVGAFAVAAGEISGYVGAEGTIFFHDALFPEQEDADISLALEPEYYYEWADGSSFTFVPFGRLDGADSNRTHFDIRELNCLWLDDRWEVRVGVGKVFWGTTEFVHLVDIINQTDAVESIDWEERLGQPMLHLAVPSDWGVVDMFVLPYFRERTFPGPRGRPRLALMVDTDNARYESPDERHHVDLAVRYSHWIGNWDFGVYYFGGTGREPTLVPEINDADQPVLIPFYELIGQTGLDAQLVAGEWLLKLEAIYRTGQGPEFFSAVGGFEYTFTAMAGTRMDLGVIGQYANDDRGKRATTPYENDLMLGLRLARNDQAGTELLAGFVYDVRSSARILVLEGSRRIGSNLRVNLEAWGFVDFPEDDPYYSMSNDDYMRLELIYFY
jgi:hypothetical protein